MLWIGHVDKCDEGTGYLKLVDEEGHISFAQIDRNKLSVLGIAEGDSLTYEIKEVEGKMIDSFTRLPDKVLTKEDYDRVDQELDEMFPD
jgi:hypothetical protein